MNSTSTSEPILNISHLDLVYKLDYYKKLSAREAFISWVKSPLGNLLAPRDSLHVLKDINLQVKQGERVGILGVNGTGKTTLCRVIAKMIVPTRGEINVRGNVRAIFNTAIGVLPELTGRENAEILATLLYPECSQNELDQIVSNALEFSELGDFLNVPFIKYSKGMAARLCLSMISARPCELLVLDEIFDGADQFFQKKISQRVLNMIINSGAVIFVSHAIEQIRLACSRVVVMNKAQIIFDGNVDEGIDVYLGLNPEKFKII